jgi:hypothetical protein
VGKKRKGQQNSGYRPDDDKPDYAMDKMLPEVKVKTPKVPREEQILVEDRINQSVFSKLASLKAKMEAEAAETAVESTKKTSKKRQPAVRRPDPDDKDVSFAELFDPAPEDEESFEEMLEASKQDWREYK